MAAAFDFVVAPQVEVGEGIPAESVQISGAGVVAGEVSLTTGDELRLTAAVLPAETTDPGVRWTSSDEAVAAVAADGTVTAVAPGSAVIAATTVDGTELTAEVTVTVTAKPDEGGSGNEGGSGSGTESGAGGCKGSLAGDGWALAAGTLTLGALGWRVKRKQRREHP